MNDAAAFDTPGTRGRRLPQLLEPLAALLGRDAALLHVDVDDENRIAIEPGIAGRQREERAGEEAGGDDERERQRDLQHDERIADADAAVVARRRGPVP